MRLLPYTFSSGNARPHETDISSSEVLDKFSKGGIFRCAHLIILSFLFAFLSILSLSFFLPFLFPLSPLSSSLAAVFYLIRIHPIPDFFYTYIGTGHYLSSGGLGRWRILFVSR